MIEIKTIKQEIDSPILDNTHAVDADRDLNALLADGWQIENMVYRPWQDGPHDLYMDRYVTLKRDISTVSISSGWTPEQSGNLLSLVGAYVDAHNEYFNVKGDASQRAIVANYPAYKAAERAIIEYAKSGFVERKDAS